MSAAETATGKKVASVTGDVRPRSRIEKARKKRAFLASLHISTEDVNGWWRTQSPSNPSQIPDSLNREINREFCRFRPLRCDLTLNRRVNSITSSQIPYAI
jgi:hypothetical protein